MTQDKAKGAAAHAAKRLARLAAVQALYQSHYGQQPLAQILRDHAARHYADFHDEEAAPDAPDAELFNAIVKGVAEHTEALDAMIAGALDARFSAARLELILRAILRAGAFELHHHGKISAGVIINDYIDIARAFYNGKEAGLVNGILDRLAGKLRAA